MACGAVLWARVSAGGGSSIAIPDAARLGARDPRSGSWFKDPIPAPESPPRNRPQRPRSRLTPSKIPLRMHLKGPSARDIWVAGPALGRYPVLTRNSVRCPRSGRSKLICNGAVAMTPLILAQAGELTFSNTWETILNSLDLFRRAGRDSADAHDRCRSSQRVVVTVVGNGLCVSGLQVA